MNLRVILTRPNAQYQMSWCLCLEGGNSDECVGIYFSFLYEGGSFIY